MQRRLITAIACLILPYTYVDQVFGEKAIFLPALGSHMYLDYTGPVKTILSKYERIEINKEQTKATIFSKSGMQQIIFDPMKRILMTDQGDGFSKTLDFFNPDGCHIRTLDTEKGKPENGGNMVSNIQRICDSSLRVINETEKIDTKSLGSSNYFRNYQWKEKNSYIMFDKSLNQTNEARFNQYGDLIYMSSRIKDNTGVDQKTVDTYQYIYDKRGNWIKRTIKDSIYDHNVLDNQPTTEIDERQISYYNTPFRAG